MRLRTSHLGGYANLAAYVGDLHNHCGISYGHGPIEDAFSNARLQLDFATVTGHAWWHDMPDEPELAALRNYHLEGFERLSQCWTHVQDITEGFHEDGRFVTFLSLEWHSMLNGDHCVYFNGSRGPLLHSPSLEALRLELRALRAGGLDVMMLPHHVGYLQGSRGANWGIFTEEFTPLVEMISMHGLALDDDGPHPYLHTMGPVDGRSTVSAALSNGLRFGVIGSTDHHSAHPGSHGYGRAMVWADGLTRDSLWEAMQQRRTYAVTGDPIMLATQVNGTPMGGDAGQCAAREVTVEVGAVDEIDVVELHRNGRLIAEQRPSGQTVSSAFTGTLGVSLGWGDLERVIDWDVTVTLENGKIHAVEPRLHGFDVVAPATGVPETYAISNWRQTSDGQVVLTTRTSGNPTVTSDATQGLALFVEAGVDARLRVSANGVEFVASVEELRQGARTGYLGGFVSGAVKLHRATNTAKLNLSLEQVDHGSGNGVDHYTCHVRQRNEQHAWSSPTWADTE